MSEPATLFVTLEERLFTGSPRWYGDDPPPYDDAVRRPQFRVPRQFFGVETLRRDLKLAWADTGRPGYSSVDAYRHQRGGRTPAVGRAMDAFFGTAPGAETIPYLMTCVNPTCAGRTQSKHLPMHRGVERVREAHRAASRCETCGRRLVTALVRPIRNKWVYVFTGEPGEDVTLEQELRVREAEQWEVHARSGAGGPREDRATPVGRVPAAPLYEVDVGRFYQFFLSPVQLSAEALSLLRRLATERDVDHEGYELIDLHGEDDEQLTLTTVARRFENPPTGSHFTGGAFETVPVLDAFAWVEESAEWDYRPALQARYDLLTDDVVAAKRDIAAVLSNQILTGSTDSLDLRSQMDDQPHYLSRRSDDGAGRAPSRAEAWVDQYRDYVGAVSEATEAAGRRVVAWLDSDAHRVVELSCQEELHAPGPDLNVSPLAFGLVHYARILRDLPGCRAGEAYTVRLVSDRPAFGSTVHKHDADRIPVRNVLRPTGGDRRALAAVRRRFEGVPLVVLTSLAPALVAQAPPGEEAEVLRTHLERIGVTEATVVGEFDLSKPMGYPEVSLPANGAVGPDATELYAHRVTRSKLPERMVGAYADSKLRLFDRSDRFVPLASLWIGLKLYGNDSKPNERQTERLARMRGKAEYPFKVVSYASNQSRLRLAHWAEQTYGIDINAVAAGKTVGMSEGAVEAFVADPKRFTRNVRFYRYLDALDRLVLGPVAVFFGGVDIVLQTAETIRAWRDGNPGLMAGSALLATGAVLSAASAMFGAVAKTTAFAGTAAATSLAAASVWLSVAAVVVILGGLLVVWLWADSPLEQFADHCFLGDEYGEGSDDGPAWAGGESYATWDTGDDRFLRQHQYMLSLLCSFKVLVHPIPRSVRPREELWWGATIQPGYTPPGTIAEVVVENEYQPGTEDAVSSTTAAYVELDSGEWILTGDEPAERFVRTNDGVPWGSDEFVYFQVKMAPKIPADKRTEPKRLGDVVRRWTVKVRLHVPGGSESTIPSEGFLTISNRGAFLDRVKSSLDP